ncbi:hypothetical protein D047_1787B, partial [Vibrio parahaemolyticus VPTS-2010_2]
MVCTSMMVNQRISHALASAAADTKPSPMT